MSCLYTNVLSKLIVPFYATRHVCNRVIDSGI
ncbi:hypothetical protein MEG_00276 [Bartonella tamiae Th307]|uniref:Uncharacterized protein n=1 Tax=Bartonella tamiae Th239 TaxID=1094558 RepID=J1JWT8_9HYPH|nr:hypothetical protein ME5_01606 [Bartonella tamiae Th239]EJF94695.1 hypothetical protein MEG_00276 [Bartonella tamiae Th307]